jgi:hypothetical protein
MVGDTWADELMVRVYHGSIQEEENTNKEHNPDLQNMYFEKNTQFKEIEGLD